MHGGLNRTGCGTIGLYGQSSLVAILSVVAAFLNVINDMVQMHEIFVASIAVRSHELEA